MVFKPNIESFGVPYAFFVRNGLIVKYSDEVYAFWDGKSKGTLDGIKKAKIAGKMIKVEIWNVPGLAGEES